MSARNVLNPQNLAQVKPELLIGAGGGGGGGLPAAVDYSSYLFYNSVTADWETGASEVHIGQGAGLAGTTPGTASVAVGAGCGQIGTLAAGTVAIGDNAASGGTVGIDNVVIGHQAGYSGTPGQYNVMVGGYAGRLGVGNNNTLLGYGAASLATGLAGVTVINATGGSLNPPDNTTNAAYIAPVREAATGGTSKMLTWDTASKEIVAAPLPSGTLPAGSASAQYLYYNGTAWVVGSSEVKLGLNAGANITPGGQSVAIGQGSLGGTDGGSGVAIGINAAGNGSAGGNVSIGQNAGRGTLAAALAGAIAIGSGAASVVGGYQDTICIGKNAGQQGVFDGAIAIGRDIATGVGGTIGDNSVVIGDNAAVEGCDTECVVIGYRASQGTNAFADSVVIGTSAAQLGQAGESSVSVGSRAAQNGSGTATVAIGYFAGATTAPGDNNVLVGHNAGRQHMGNHNVILGALACQNPSGASGLMNQCTVINATGSQFNPPRTSSDSLFITPIRAAATGGTVNKMLAYDDTTKEIVAAPLPGGGAGVVVAMGYLDSTAVSFSSFPSPPGYAAAVTYSQLLGTGATFGTIDTTSSRFTWSWVCSPTAGYPAAAFPTGPIYCSKGIAGPPGSTACALFYSGATAPPSSVEWALQWVQYG